MATGRLRCRAHLPLLLLLWACADGDGEGHPCDAPGRSEPCACDDGRDGNRLCLPEGVVSSCRCDVTRTVPCGHPGTPFPCFCDDAGVGVEYCLADGRYSSCDCSSAGASGEAASDASAGEGGGQATVQAGCPAPFACAEQMGATFCADAAGIPPLCESAADCAVAGLPDAGCLDPGVGITVCLQLCELP